MKDSSIGIDIDSLFEQETELASLSTRLPCCEVKGKTLPVGLVLEDSFKIIRTLKIQPYGAIYLARNLVFKDEFCIIKEVCGAYAAVDGFGEARILLRKEANILKGLNHPQVSHFIAYFTNGDCSFLILDYIDGKSLAQLMAEQTTFFTESQTIKWIREISNILRYIHSQEPKALVYKNLRPENIIICKSSNTAMLIDFAQADYTDSSFEQITDIKELSSLMFELLTRRKLIITSGDMVENILDIVKINTTVSEKLVDIVREILLHFFEKTLTAKIIYKLLETGNCKKCGMNLSGFKDSLCQSCQMRKEKFDNSDSRMQSYFRKGIELANLTIPDDAVEAFDNGAALQKQFAEMYYHLGYTFFNQGENLKAVEMFQKSALFEQSNADLYIMLGQAHEREGQLEDAATAYHKAIACEEENYLYNYHLGRVLMKIGEPDQALTAYRQSSRSNPGFADLFYEMANALYSLKKYFEAAMTIKKALAICPDIISYHYLLANTYEMLGIMDEAEKEYRYIYTAEPANTTALMRLAIVLKQKRNYAEAIKQFEQFTLLIPDNAEIYYLLGDTLNLAGMPERAIQALRRSIELDPSEVNAYNYLGQIFTRLEDYQAAVEMFELAVQTRPEEPFAYHNLGTVLLRLNKLDEAVVAFEKAIELKVDDVTVRRTIAHIYIKKSLYSKALDSLQKAVALSPDVLEAHYELGLVAVSLEAWDIANRAFREVLAVEKRKSEATARLMQFFKDKAMTQDAKSKFEESMQLKADAAKWGVKASQWLQIVERKDNTIDSLKEFAELKF